MRRSKAAGSPHIGPHEGKELELMLSGSKPMALFWRELGMPDDHVGDSGFAKHVDEGRILKFTECEPDRSIETYRYCLPTEEWRAKLSTLISRMCTDGTAFEIFTPHDLGRLEGTLLGYSKESIEAFVANAVTCMPSSDEDT